MRTLPRLLLPPFLTALFLALAAVPSAAQESRLTVPKNDGWVTDLGGMLKPEEERELEALMESYKQGSSHEIALLTIPSLQGEPIERFALEVGREWGLGTKEKNNGALLVVSKEDRKLRIEVGRGLEGNLTDSISGRIIRGVIVPEFKRGRFGLGLKNGIVAMHEAIGGSYRKVPKASQPVAIGLAGLIPILVFFIILIAILSRLRRWGGGGQAHHGGSWLPWLVLASGSSGRHRSSGGGFGGGFGGGGFSGFGGGGGVLRRRRLGRLVMFPLIPTLLQAGEDDAWEPGAHPFLYLVAEYGPWAFLALAVGLVLRALVRRSRYRAVSVLDSKAQETVHEAIREVEGRTVGEIVPVVLERSDGYPGAAWLCALCTMLLGSALLERHLPWYAPHWLLLCQVGIGAVGFLLATYLPDLQRLFVSEARASEMAAEQALQEFHLLGLRDTRERTGVLLFVSLFERRVIVLGDAGIHARVGDAHWQLTKDAILEGAARGSLADGLVHGVRACGHVLAEHFPKASGDPNEIADRLIVRAR